MGLFMSFSMMEGGCSGLFDWRGDSDGGGLVAATEMGSSISRLRDSSIGLVGMDLSTEDLIR